MGRIFPLMFSLLFLVRTMAAPVELTWANSETMPTKVARPIAGFLPNGEFLLAGGSNFENGKKVYYNGIFVRNADGTWKCVGTFPCPIAESACCETPRGVFSAGGTDGKTVYDHAAILSTGGKLVQLVNLPEKVRMCAAACDGTWVYVVAAKNVYAIELDAQHPTWQKVAEIPGSAREQHVAAIQKGGKKGERMLFVYGGYESDSHMPLPDGYALSLSAVGGVTGPAEWKQISPLPPQVTTIGATFLSSGKQNILMTGGFGWHGWIDRAVKGLNITDMVRLGWQRKVWMYDTVEDAWREFGAIASNDLPRCGAAAGLWKDAASGVCKLLIVGGECGPKLRTNAVSIARYGDETKPGVPAWTILASSAIALLALIVWLARRRVK